MNYSYFFKNGFDIIILCLCLGYEHKLFAFYLFLKTFSMNYYTQFAYLYPNPQYIKWKHLIRLTDTGHIANFLFYYYPKLLPLCHNIHFIISIGYYFTTFFFGMRASDEIENENICYTLQIIHSELNHSIPFLILTYYNTQDRFDFNNDTLIVTYLWVYSWLFCIYIPWRYYTGDPVYSILDNNTSYKIKLIVFFFMNFLVFLGNEFGRFVQTNNQIIIKESFN